MSEFFYIFVQQLPYPFSGQILLFGNCLQCIAVSEAGYQKIKRSFIL